MGDREGDVLTLEDFHYELPQSFVAKRPLSPRGSSRLMVLDRAAQSIEHSTFGSLASYLEEGDCIVFNDTKVMPCRLSATRTGTGGRVEVLFVRKEGESRWEALVRPARRLRSGSRLVLSGGSTADVVERLSGASFLLSVPEPFEEYMESWGQMPIPPYMKRFADEGDREDYQTVYARVLGSCAAPTAGLHFTRETLRRLEARGVEMAKVLLHVGPGTFQPLKPGPLAGQTLGAEYYDVTSETCQVVNRARGRGGRVFAVGTSTARALETLAEGPGLRPARGWTEKFIYPPYDFNTVDALITNFHLPRSSVLLLTCAFAGREFVLSAYEEAKRAGYRFYSYGDSMLIV